MGESMTVRSRSLRFLVSVPCVLALSVATVGSAEDPDAPGTVVTSELEQYYVDTFLFDSDGDGVVDNDATFCDRTGEPGFMMWFRNRLAVGERQLNPHRGGRRVSP